MGFYGNITNTARTQFQFDKKYASRYEMEQNKDKDGVYTGRYVLIEYDQNQSSDIYPNTYYRIGDVLYRTWIYNEDNILIPTTREDILQTVITQRDIQESVKGTSYSNKIFCIQPGRHVFNQNATPQYIRVKEFNAVNYITNYEMVTETEFEGYWGDKDITLLNRQIFRVNGELITPTAAVPNAVPNVVYVIPPGYSYSTNSSIEYVVPKSGNNSTTIISYTNQETGEEQTIYDVPLWKTIAEISENHADLNTDKNFLVNFQTDVSIYGTARGYDSTVWQKVYSGGIEKYVMVAELNTVVPTFDVTADAPSLIPIMPHFDTDSTNVYYKLHWQPQWGFRIKSARQDLTGPAITINGEVNTSIVQNLTSDGVLYPSDEITQWTSNLYNKNQKVFTNYTYNPVLQTWQLEPETANLDAAIYYNKNGFNPEEISYSDDLLLQKDSNGHLLEGTISSYSASGWKNEDKITISPSGFSGNQYHQHDIAGSVDYKSQIDTQEFSIMLPSIGNSIAHFWDMVYGGRNTTDLIKDTNQRNLDIAWEDGGNALARQGLRLTNLKPDGNGFTLDESQVNTVAGIINTAHDLLGMIIVNTEEGLTGNALADAPSTSIYYNAAEGSYNRKALKYLYQEVQYSYEEIEVSEEDYSPYIFYIKNNGEYEIAEDSNFDEKETYYKKIISDETPRWKPVTLYPFTPGYYIKTANGEWTYEKNSQPLEHVSYYEFQNGVRANLSGKYEANKYYYPVIGGTSSYDINGVDLKLSTDETASKSRVYYEITSSQKPVNINMMDKSQYDSENGTYGWTVAPDEETLIPQELVYIYEPDRFYYEGTNPQDPSQTVLFIEKLTQAEWKTKYDNNDPEIMERQYLALDKTVSKEAKTIMIQDEHGNIVPATIINNIVNVSGSYKVKLIPFEENKYYFRQNISEIENPNITSIDDPLTLQIVGTWRLLTPELLTAHYNAQFIEEVDGNQPIFVDYYTLEKSLQGNFYITNLYWYKTSDLNWVKDRNLKMTEGREYYQTLNFTKVNKEFYMPFKYYYKNDEEKYLIDVANTMTNGRQYYSKHPIFVMEDILNLYPRGAEWLANETDLVPASIKLAFKEESETLVPLAGFARELNTINGLILKMNHMLEIDNIDTRDKRTLQGSINVINDYICKFNELTPRELLIVDNYGRIHSSPWQSDQWLKVKISANPQNPELTFEHLYNPVANTTSEITEVSRGDTINLYTPIVDATGHVVGHNDETVTLPFTFKILKSENSSDDENLWSQTAGATHSTGESTDNVVADNTKDILTLSAGNKWIRLQSDAVNDKITFAHETHNVVTTASTTDFNAVSSGNTFIVQDLIFDLAGHVTENKPHVFTLPYSYKTISVSNTTDTTIISGTNGNVVAQDILETLAFEAQNKWIKLVADNNNTLIGIAHEIHAITNTAKTDTDLETVSEFTVQDLEFDAAGHVTANQSHKYTLPNNFKTINITGTSVSTTSITGNTAAIVADSSADSFNLKTGNRWIEINGDATNDEIVIGHAAAGSAAVSKGDTTAQTPNFGATFKALSASIDQMGHIVSLEEHNVTIPKPSMATIAASNDSVLNSASLTDTTGAFTFGTKKVGTLLLTEYSSTSSLVAATDSINGAFKKIAEKIDTIDTSIGDINTALDIATDAEIDAIFSNGGTP